MKIGLFLLFLVATSFVNAQLSAPNTGVNTITNITATTATVNYAVRTNGTFTNVRINFSLASNMNPITGQSGLIGFSNFGSWQNSSYNLSGLTPNTTYYVRCSASNSLGTINSNILSFTTVGSNATQGIIAEYTFDNTRANIAGTESFSSTNTSFTTNRVNAANSALSISAGAVGTSTTITGLPIGNSARTISFWYKVDSNVNNSAIFTYGTTGASQFGMYIQSTGRPVFWSNLAEPVFGTGSFAANTWHHAVLTHDGTNVRIYMNGVLQDIKQFTASTIASEIKFFNASTTLFLDDLKIYDSALTDSQVLDLFTNNTLSTQNFNQNNLEVALYPNPATSLLTIKMASEIKSVEIYNLQGQKILKATQKDINISTLASGMYIVKIQDSENKTATKKIIKN
jgi:hypothetical protein